MKHSVLVIGGGIAGLAAADELGRHGFRVNIIEAKDRFGGRIHTQYENRHPIELGAEFVHGESPHLLATIKAAKLSCRAVPDKNQIFEHGKFKPIDLWKIVGDIFKRINLREPDSSFAQFLEAQSLSDRNRQLGRDFVSGFDAAYPDRISAHALLRAEQAAEKMNGDKQYRIVEGYSALVNYLAQKVTENGAVLSKNTVVRRIHWGKGRIQVLAERNRNEEIFEADMALITLPVGVLKMNTVKFVPPLTNKLAAVREIQFGNVMKIIFHFRKSFWDDCGIIHAVNERIPTWWSEPQGAFLTGWAGGPQADALLGFSPVQIENLGLDILSRLFPLSISRLREGLMRSHFWNWTNDPYSGGAYSYLPVNGLDLPGLLAAPVDGNLFFAGEATVSDAQMGTVFGALETGLRAAQEIMSHSGHR